MAVPATVTGPSEPPQSGLRHMTLHRAHVIFRHGARTPTKPTPDNFPHVPYDAALMAHPEHTFVDCHLVDATGADLTAEVRQVADAEKFGLLTASGARQIFQLGSQLCAHYAGDRGLVGRTWSGGEVALMSTKRRRCLDSMRALLAGFYGPQAAGHSFPVSVERQKGYEVLNAPTKCSPYLQRMRSELKDRADEIVPGKLQAHLECQEILGVEEKLPMAVFNDHVRCHDHHGVLPERYSDARLVKLLTQNATATLRSRFERKDHPGHKMKMIKATVGRFLAILKDGLNPDNATAEFSMYSSHDGALVALLLALGGYLSKWPPFGSHIIFELWRDDQAVEEDQWFVRVMYNWEALELPACGPDRLCPLDKFLELLSTHAASKEEHEEICEL